MRPPPATGQPADTDDFSVTYSTIQKEISEINYTGIIGSTQFVEDVIDPAGSDPRKGLPADDPQRHSADITTSIFMEQIHPQHVIHNQAQWKVAGYRMIPRLLSKENLSGLQMASSLVLPFFKPVDKYHSL